MTLPSVGPDDQFVVRTPGHWWLTQIALARCERATLDQVQGSLDPELPERGRSHSGPTSPDASGGDDMSWWRPVWMWVGSISGSRVWVENTAGGQVALDAKDLRLIDVLDFDLSVGEIASRSRLAVGECRTRLDRLAGAGVVLHRSESPHQETDVDAAPVAAHRSTDAAPPDSVSSGGSPAIRRVRRPTMRERLNEWRRGSASADRRVPVYSIWHPQAGPLLSLGMLTASARAHGGGELEDAYEIRRPETATSFLNDWSRRKGPAVLLCSDYVWSVEKNLQAAREASAMGGRLLVVHGGPSCPAFERDADRFLDVHGDVAHVLVRGEGEHVLPRILEALRESDYRVDASLLDIPGLTFRSSEGATVRTDDQARIADLDTLPSPYLTGEFDDIPPESWMFCLSVETTRGCPYGCSFCDWGSATLSRIRKFDLERVAAEIEWAARRGVNTINITDANFGIISRDVDTASAIAGTRERTGFPKDVAFYPAKNTTKHLAEIMDVLLGAGILPAGSLSLQTSDPDALDAVDRSNISTQHYVALAAEYRRRGLPLHGDLLIGIPAQTFESFKRDLQFNLDHEIMSRTWQVQLLPNAPMNAPEYRTRHGIEVDGAGRVTRTASFGPADRDKMLELRRVDAIFERYGVLRHVMRFVQWDHGLDATELMVRVLEVTKRDPSVYPLLAWVVSFFDRHPTTAKGWVSFYAEVAMFLERECGIEPDSSTQSVLAVQTLLMPSPGRTFPASVHLAHDYVSYYRNATASLYLDGAASGPNRALHDWGPAVFTVDGDPLELCQRGMSYPSQSDDPAMEDDFVIGGASAYELDSELLRNLPWVAAQGMTPRLPPTIRPGEQRVAVGKTRVRLGLDQS